MAFYFVSTFAIAQTPTKQPALRLSRTKNLHFAKAPFPGFSAGGLVFLGNFGGALTVAFMMPFVYTYGFSIEPGVVGQKIATIGEARTLGYAQYGVSGWFTIFIRGMLCNWMVSMGVVGAMISTTAENQGNGAIAK